jgi:hypothetical protein
MALGATSGRVEPQDHPKQGHRIHPILPSLWRGGYPPPQTWNMGRPGFGATMRAPISEPARTRWTNWTRPALWP